MNVNNKALYMALLPVFLLLVPLLSNMETQTIFGMSNSFWSGTIIGISLVGFVFLMNELIKKTPKS